MNVETDPIAIIDTHLAETASRQTVTTLEVRDWLLDLRLLLASVPVEEPVGASSL